MTSIDVDERCKELGISRASYESAMEKKRVRFWELRGNVDVRVETYPDFMTDDEILAICRYNGLYISFPEIFDYNGIIRPERSL